MGSLTENLYNEEELQGFLIGDLSESERAAIEERFLADEDFSAQVHVVEDELIESYLRRELSARDHQRFEAAFLTQPRRRERVLVMKGVLAAANAEAPLQAEQSPSLWAGLLASLRFRSAFARYAVAAGVLFVVAFGALLVFNKLGSKQNGPLAQRQPGPIQPGATASVSPHSSPDISRPQQTPSSAVTPVPRTNPSPTPEAQLAGPAVATIILRPTLVRDPGGANKVVVSSSVQKVRLQLNLERNDYKAYAIRITTVEGRLVWQRGSVKSHTTNAGTSLSVFLPARLLATDDYLVEVSGVSDAGPPESLANYFFSVARASRP